MKTLVDKKYFGIILMAITLILPSCYPDYEDEIIKKLEAPAWITSEVKYNGFVTLTWAPVEGALSYDIYESSTYNINNEYNPKYSVGSTEMTTFTYYNPDWNNYTTNTRSYVYYGVRMVDEKGNVGGFKETGGIRWTVKGQ